MKKNKVIVSTENLFKKYQLGNESVSALQDINLEVYQGEFLALAGSSGSGKTTMMNLFGCLDQADEGKITVDGNEVQKMHDNELSNLRAKKIGFIFQNFNLIPVLTARENVEYPILRSHLNKTERRKKAEDALCSVGLKGYGDRFPSALSGGQRQRVAIARAIVHEPIFILADEPTASLDKKNATEVFSILTEMNKTKDVTIIFSSHDQLALSFAQRTVHLSDGRIQKID